MVEVNWTDQALDDIDNIALFISQDSEKYARIQVTRFFDRADPLSNNPKIGRIVPEPDDAAIRELPEGNYRNVYKIVSKTQIDILTVHHSRRLVSNNPAFHL